MFNRAMRLRHAQNGGKEPPMRIFPSGWTAAASTELPRPTGRPRLSVWSSLPSVLQPGDAVARDCRAPVRRERSEGAADIESWPSPRLHRDCHDIAVAVRVESGINRTVYHIEASDAVARLSADTSEIAAR